MIPVSRKGFPLAATLALASLLPLSLNIADASFQNSDDASFRERVSATNLTSVDDLISDVQAEIELGKDVAAKILGRHPLVEDQEDIRYVNLLGNVITRFASRPELKFHFAIIDSDEINAYSAPGGYIFVTRGAIDMMQDEAELAAVLAHEIAHVTQKHIVKELDIRGTDNSTSAGIGHFLGGASDPARVAFKQAVDKAMEILFTRGLKKTDEFEADRVGTLLTLFSGYDPTALHRYLERVKQVKGADIQILSHTHPPFEDRLSELDQLLIDEGLASIQAATLTQRFTDTIKK